MSAKQTGLVWELNLPQNEAWVLMAMADHADHDGNNVYPGVPRLAWKTGYTTRQIRRILAILQAKGLIVVEEAGGGRRTTRYRLDLAGADRKDPHRPEYARSGRAESVPASEAREDKMSPLPSAAPEERMSPQPGQNVMAARTQLCHPNRQGREGKEPSIPPPSASSPHQRSATAAGATPDSENGEGGENNGDDQRGAGEAPRASSSSAEAIWRAWAGWAGREGLPADRRRSIDRQAERLASGHDLEAWTHSANGAVAPSENRPRIFKLGLQLQEGMTSRTLRGGAMYAVAKCYRTSSPVPGTEYAAVVATALPGDDRNRPSSGSTDIVAAASTLQRQEGRAWVGRDPRGGARLTRAEMLNPWLRAYALISERARSHNMPAGPALAAERGGRQSGREKRQSISGLFVLCDRLRYAGNFTGLPAVRPTRDAGYCGFSHPKVPTAVPVSGAGGYEADRTLPHAQESAVLRLQAQAEASTMRVAHVMAGVRRHLRAPPVATRGRNTARALQPHVWGRPGRALPSVGPLPTLLQEEPRIPLAGMADSLLQYRSALAASPGMRGRRRDPGKAGTEVAFHWSSGHLIAEGQSDVYPDQQGDKRRRLPEALHEASDDAS